jgi:hypothetical protein
MPQQAVKYVFLLGEPFFEMTRWERLRRWWMESVLRKLIVAAFTCEIRYEQRSSLRVETWEQEETRVMRSSWRIVGYGAFTLPMVTVIATRVLTTRLQI